MGPWPRDVPARRYSPDVGQADADEQDTIDGIIKGLTEQSQTGRGVSIRRCAPVVPSRALLVTNTLEAILSLYR